MCDDAVVSHGQHMRRCGPDHRSLGSGVAYDVPSLIEVWRTTPCLHSRDAITLRETITDFSPIKVCGRTKDLDELEIEYLIKCVGAYRVVGL
jgi:hypothetical protein